jgi:hypothetical protein
VAAPAEAGKGYSSVDSCCDGCRLRWPGAAILTGAAIFESSCQSMSLGQISIFQGSDIRDLGIFEELWTMSSIISIT